MTYTVTDETGGTASCSFSVTVTDTEAPTLSLPANIVLSAPATQCGAAVSFSATATDNCSGATVTAVPASGSTFPVGTTTVLVSAVDATGNTSSGSFLVTVNDVTAPTVLTQNISVTLAGGTASITAAQVENGSTDACGIASRSVSPSAFTCATTGPQTVTLTVTDVHGNTATGTATVTVLGGLATPSITVTKASLPYTGGGSNTLFLGYGPQTATLTASAGGTSYAWSPATGLSNANVANPVFTASVAGSFTYSVLVTNVSGCTATASVTMRVVDARCGSKNEKVLVCHDGHEICISPNAVDTHLTSPSHHDQLGPCGNSARSVASGTGPTELSVFPNPTTERATVSFRTPTAGPAQVRIYNELGQLVSTVFDGLTQAGELRTVTLDSQPLAAGVYLCRLVTNSSTETIRLMVAR